MKRTGGQTWTYAAAAALAGLGLAGMAWGVSGPDGLDESVQWEIEGPVDPKYSESSLASASSRVRAPKAWGHEERDRVLDVEKSARGSSGGADSAAAQPGGSLSDIVVYCSAGHGFTYVESGNYWRTQRPLLYGMVEDMGNIDQLNYFADYCFKAGATVVPMRPLGDQTNEVVVDNVSAGVTWGGTWHNSDSAVYYGQAGETPYRYANINATGTTAWAIYRPTIPAAGFYPVYAWARSGSDRVRQLYRVYHSGGVTDVRVNHRRVGHGWVWLGTYYFDAGTNGSVNISNWAEGYNPGNDVVIADAIRFGNGMGDVARGTAGVSGFERELEASRYWVQRMVGQGMASSLYDNPNLTDWDDNVGAPARMAAEMNRQQDGSFWDRIYLGFHSNADGGAGTQRGPMGLWDTRGTTLKQNRQKDFGALIAAELHHDLSWAASNNQVMDGYANNSANLYGSGYGELYGAINDEMNSTIIETAFHNNSLDANLLKDPTARRWMAQAAYQAVVRHLSTNNPAVPAVFLPDPPTAFSVSNSGPGQVTLRWSAPEVNSAGGDPATGYVVYQSTNGYGFGQPLRVDGAASTSATVSNLMEDAVVYFRVVATNAGGESLPTIVAAARVAPGGRAHHLVVNGFNRNDRSLTPVRYFGNGLNGNAALVRQRRINSADYIISHAQALAAAGRYFDSCGNEALLAGRVDLGDYFAAYWILGRESSRDETFSTAEQGLVQAFLQGGGRLMVSGTEIGWDLDHLGSSSDRTFMTNQLKVAYAADDSGLNQVTPSVGGIFNGLGSFLFDDGTGESYKAAYPDVYHLRGGAASALVYGPSAGGTQIAGAQYEGVSRLVVLGFPFETIQSEAVRHAFMARVAEFFGEDPQAPPALSISGGARTVPLSATNWVLNGTCINADGWIRWTNSAGGQGAVAVASPWSAAVGPLQIGLNTIRVWATNAAGLGSTQEVVLTRADTPGGNGWHIPDHTEPGADTMRMPLDPNAFQTVYIASGSQFQGEGNAADQSGGTLYYRLQGGGAWNAAALTFLQEAGNNKYWQSSIPGYAFAVGDTVEYYLELRYTDRDTTFIGTWNDGADSSTFLVRAEAEAQPFRFTYQGWSGNAWHIPDSPEPAADTMRMPLDPSPFQTVWISNGNQFQGAGNAANQTGGTLHFRRAGDALWSGAALTFIHEAGNNKYWQAAIPAHVFQSGEIIEYYLEILYGDRDVTYLSLDSQEQRVVGLAESFARQYPYTFTYGAYLGNAWHIPDSEEPAGTFMRMPVSAPAPDAELILRSGSQYQGEGNAANQTGLTLQHRLAGEGWSEINGGYEAEEGLNRYWKAIVPAGTYRHGEAVQYVLRLTYSDRDDTWLGVDADGHSAAYATAAAAQAMPFEVVYAPDDSPPGSDNAQQIAESAPLHRAVLQPGETFRKTWTLRNTGRRAWTAAGHVELRQCSGDNFDPPESDSTILPLAPADSILPGETHVWEIEGVAPAVPGEYRGVWMMHRDAFFGDPVWIHILVEEEAGP